MALLALLVALGVVYGANAAHLYALEQSLESIAREKREFVTAGTKVDGVTSVTTVNKAYGVAGPTSAKIEVYVRDVPPGQDVEGGYLWVGTPARRVRPLREQERDFLDYSAKHYVDLKNGYLAAR